MNKFIIISFLFTLIACSKDDTSIASPATTSFISMKINGVAWKGDVNFVSGLFQNNYSAQATFKVDGKSQIASFGFENANLSGTNILDEDSPGAFIFFDNASSKTWGFGSGSSGIGEFKITKKKAAGTITQASATFSGTTKDDDGKTIVVTEGLVFNAQAE